MKGGGPLVRVTFVYGSSTPAERQELWHYLQYQSSINAATPWLVTGDFNAIMRRQQGRDSIMRKLDWAFGNHHLLRQWPQAKATFQARIESDHSPIIISLSSSHPYQKARFKFLNLWAEQDGYEEIIRAAWGTEAYGNPFSRLTTKLRNLKGHLHFFHRSNSSHISSRVAQADKKWQEARVFLDQHPQDQDAGRRERDLCHQFSALRNAEESFYKQSRLFLDYAGAWSEL
ncbi:hypothetical protein OIU84_022261 [Salix udensis]|uniref:Endonuclease/exonuclease/phosphatase domain-containing protein n=1 Tax=Salix udensis TaxID=889485 RepID=A0AAD6PEY0_9ROSI|nr:hypothetical protein OIU84_022261 [Salix udensis]